MSTYCGVTPNLDLNPWRDLAHDCLADNAGPLGFQTAKVERIGLMPDGTDSGHPTVMVLLRLPDGRQLLAETTWRIWSTATQALAVSPVVRIDEELNP